MKFKIEGGYSLNGEIKVGGSKNEALAIIAATILINGKTKLTNVPEITDVEKMLKLLESMGAKVKRNKNKIEIDSSTISSTEPDFDLVRCIRASILLIGPLLARFGKIKIPQPGGCFIGSRPVDTHFKAFENLGVRIREHPPFYILEAPNGISPGKIILEEMSVTATENVIMAASITPGTTEVRLAATEPHVENLILFLNKAGAKIKGGGTHNLIIEGVKNLSEIEFEISPDPIEAATFAIAGAITKGDILIKDINPNYLDMFFLKFKSAGGNFKIIQKNKLADLHIMPATMFKAINIRTDIYPGFPTDLQAPMAVLMTQAHGTSRIFETMYEGRLNYLKELIKMGANVSIQTPHQALITGPTPLYGKEITSLDLRAGATLILAALIAHGTSVINQAEIIDRGYEKIDEKLKSLGAKIEREK